MDYVRCQDTHHLLSKSGAHLSRTQVAVSVGHSSGVEKLPSWYIRPNLSGWFHCSTSLVIRSFPPVSTVIPNLAFCEQTVVCVLRR